MRGAKLLLVVVGLAGVLGAGWYAQREAACAGLIDKARPYAGAEVRRGAAGQCYACRPDGALFDIAFDVCGSSDRVHWRAS